MSASTPPNTMPHPQRYWWLKRLAAAYLLLILLTAGLRLWWGYSVNRRLDAMAAESRKTGAPILLSEFNGNPIPDEQNAAFFYKKAGTLITISKADAEISNGQVLDETTSPENLAVFERIVATNQAALDLAHDARRLNQCNWNISWTSPGYAISMRHLGLVRRIANLLDAKARLQHLRRDDCGALDTIMDLAHLSASLDSSPLLSSRLTQAVLDAKIAATISDSALSLRIGNPDNASSKSASREQVKALMMLLADDSPEQRCLKFGIESQRAALIDITRRVADGVISPTTPTPVSSMQQAVQRLLAPMFWEDGMLMAERSSVGAAAATRPDFPSAIQFQGTIRVTCPEGFVVHALSQAVFPGFDTVFSQHFAAVRLFRQAQIDLARRWYEVDRGHAPATINDLVPDYLPAVPLNPVAGGGAQLDLSRRYTPFRRAL